jgi:hypothetical protein
MRLIGGDLHASQQSIAVLDRDTGVIVEKTLKHEGEAVREFYASIRPPVVVGIEATGSMGWFLRLMEELAIECRVRHPVAIRLWSSFSSDRNIDWATRLPHVEGVARVIMVHCDRRDVWCRTPS